MKIGFEKGEGKKVIKIAKKNNIDSALMVAFNNIIYDKKAKGME